MKIRSSLSTLLTLGALLATPTLAMDATHPEGFSPEKAYQMGLPDQVDLFSGSLSVQIPLGPLTLTYGSTVWTYNYEWDDQAGEPRILVKPNRKNTAGIGWTLGWGEVYSPNHWYNTSGKWMYVDANGGRHAFYDQLHRGEDDQDPSVRYTRDSSYLRMRKVSNTKVFIEFPSGNTQSFVAPTGGGGTMYALTKSWSAFASESDPDFSVSYVRDGSDELLEWIKTDRYDRGDAGSRHQ